MRKLNLSKTLLKKLYLKSSSIDIGNKLNCCSNTVIRYLKQYNIPVRNHQQAGIKLRKKLSQSLKKYDKSLTNAERKEIYSTPQSGDKHPNYKPIGSFYISKWNGYKMIKVDNKKWTGEHRLIAEKILGRKLQKGEVIHHIDENKINNNPKNLYLFIKRGLHTSFTNLTKENIIDKNILKSNLLKIKENGDVK